MQSAADILMTTIGWVVVLVTFPKLKGNKEAPLFFWSFLIFFSLSFTFQIDPLYLAIDTALPVNNATWWLSYLAIIVAMALLVIGCQKLSNGSTTIPVKFMALITAIGTGILYLLFLMDSSESTVRDYPRSWMEVLYIGILHVYTVTTLYIGPVRTFSVMAKREVIVSARLRAFAFLVSATAGLLWQILKLLRIVLILFVQHPLINILPGIFPVLLGISAVALLLAFLPNSLYIRSVSHVERVGDTYALLQSRWLAQQLEPLWRPLAVITVPLELQLRQPSLYLRRQVYYVFDCRKALTQEMCEQTRETGRSIYYALQRLPETDDYSQMVRGVVEASWYLWVAMLRRKLSITRR